MSRTGISGTEVKGRLRAVKKCFPDAIGPEDVSDPKPAPKRFKPPLKAIGELEALNANGWGGAEPRHLVALYAWLHERVYSIPADDLIGDPLSWFGAVSSATKLIREEFGGDPKPAVEWMRWVWAREKKNEDRRRSSGDDSTWRIGWRYMFCKRSLLVDYRRAMASAKERASV